MEEEVIAPQGNSTERESNSLMQYPLLPKDMIKKTYKQIEVEGFVDDYTKTFGFPPRYKDIQDKFSLSACASYARCRLFRHKMRVNSRTTAPAKSQRIQYVYYVPKEKMERFLEIQSEVKKLLSDES